MVTGIEIRQCTHPVGKIAYRWVADLESRIRFAEEHP